MTARRNRNWKSGILAIALCVGTGQAEDWVDQTKPDGETRVVFPASGLFRDLSLMEAIRMGVANNLGGKVEKLQETIEDARVSGKKAEFHPAFSLSGMYESISKPQNTQEFVATQSALNPRTSRIFEEENYRFKSAITGKTPLGTEYEFGIELNSLRNTLNIERPPSLFYPEYESFAGLRLTQPLLKDAGFKVQYAGLRVAQADRRLATLAWRLKVSQVVAAIAKNYYDVAFSAEDTGIKRQNIKRARELEDINRKRMDKGVGSLIDVQQASVAASVREEELISSEYTEKVRPGGALSFVGEGLNESLTPDGDHLPASTRPGYLMNAELGAGMRRLPSMLEARMLREAWEAADAGARSGQTPSFQLAQGVFGFVVLGEAATAGLAAPNATIFNGDFSGSTSPGWTLIGGASIDGGQGLLNRGAGMLSSLVQTFVVPPRAGTLFFTLTGYQLGGGAALPPDVFEAGLFDTLTGLPLLGTIPLTGSDSLINLNGNGDLRMGPGSRLVNGTPGQGDALVFAMDLTGLTAGSVLTLDLSGFGARNSQVLIDDVRVVVGEAPAAPLGQADSYVTFRNQALQTVPDTGVLANDSDPLDRFMEVNLAQAPRHGTLTLNPDGSFEYVPDAGFIGGDIFYCRTIAGGVLSDLVAVTLEVTSVIIPPVFTLTGQGRSVNENAGPQSVPGWATGITPGLPLPGSAAVLRFVVTTDRPDLFLTAPVISPDGTLTFTPAPSANGIALITVRLQDNGGTADGRLDLSVLQTFTIEILPVNQPPTFTRGPDEFVPSNQGPVTRPGWATGITAGPADEAGQTITFLLTVARPELFSELPVLLSDGTLRYTPKPGVNGRTLITILAGDNGGIINDGSNIAIPQTFAIEILYVNVPPVFTGGSNVTVNQNGGPQTIPSWASNVKPGPEGSPVTGLTFLLTNDRPAFFSNAPFLTPEGTLSFTPAPGASGIARITVVGRNNGGTAFGGTDSTAPYLFDINILRLPDPVIPGGPGGGTPPGPPTVIDPEVAALARLFRGGFFARDILTNLSIRDALTLLAAKDLSTNLWYAGHGTAWLSSGPLILNAAIKLEELGLMAWGDSLYALVERSYHSEVTPTLQVESFDTSYTDGTLTLTLSFNADVSGSLTKEDLLILLNRTPVDPEKVSFTYDPVTRSATGKLPAADGDLLHAELPSAFVTDPHGRALDGNANGIPGDTYLLDAPVPIASPDASR